MRIKVRTPERKVTVRIVAQTPSDRFLLLQKNERSHVPGKYELPGGVVKGRKNPSLAAIRRNGAREFSEETRIAVNPEDLAYIGTYRVFFFGNGRRRRLFRRVVHVLCYQLGEEEPNVIVGNTKKSDGTEEDFHARYCLVPREILQHLAQSGELLPSSVPAVQRALKRNGVRGEST